MQAVESGKRTILESLAWSVDYVQPHTVVDEKLIKTSKLFHVFTLASLLSAVQLFHGRL